MRLSVYPSKLYLLLLSLFVCGIATMFLLAPGNFPMFGKIAIGVIAGAIVLGTLKSLISGRPVVVADEDGIQDTRFGNSVIKWKDILAFRHAPRVDKSPHGKTHSSLFEAWRPIQLWIDAPEKTLFTRLQRLKRSPKHPQFPDALYLEIDFSGLDTPSSRLVDVIREYAPTAIEE